MRAYAKGRRCAIKKKAARILTALVQALLRQSYFEQSYFEQTWAKEWHHCPGAQIVGAAPAPVPQAHLAVACLPSAQAPNMRLCAWVACANPTDITIANSAIAKLFNIISSSLVIR